MKHNPKPEEKKAAGIDDDFAVKKDSVTCCFVPACSSAAYSPALLCVQLFRRFES